MPVVLIYNDKTLVLPQGRYNKHLPLARDRGSHGDDARSQQRTVMLVGIVVLGNVRLGLKK